MAVRVDARQVEVKDRPRDAMTGHVLLYAVAAAASPLVLQLRKGSPGAPLSAR
jgi:hypothetical protein